MDKTKQLCQLMSQKLPTELRDLVYQHLYIEDHNIPVGSHHFTIYSPSYTYIDSLDDDGEPKPAASSILPDGRIKHDHAVEAPPEIPLPSSHFLNPEYVGESVAREISKYYYKNNTFSICNVEAALHHFLLSDAGHNLQNTKRKRSGAPELIVGVTPIEYITNLDIRVKCEHFLTSGLQPDDLYEYERQFISDIHMSLSPLWNNLVQRQSDNSGLQLNVTLTLMTDRNRDQRIHLNFLEAIRHTIYSLKYAENTIVNVFHYDETTSPFPKNITNSFPLTKELWDHELTINRNRIASPLHVYVAPPNVDASHLDGGVHCDKLQNVQEGRWQVSSAFDTKCIEGYSEYWPLGIECHSVQAIVDAYLDREVHKLEEGR